MLLLQLSFTMLKLFWICPEKSKQKFRLLKRNSKQNFQNQILLKLKEFKFQKTSKKLMKQSIQWLKFQKKLLVFQLIVLFKVMTNLREIQKLLQILQLLELKDLEKKFQPTKTKLWMEFKKVLERLVIQSTNSNGGNFKILEAQMFFQTLDKTLKRFQFSPFTEITYQPE